MTHRWMKFWPQDWQSDPGLRSCSLAARGLWIECIAIMHRAEPYGHLNVNGRAPSDRQLASMIGASEREVSRLVSELEQAGVFSRDASGAIFSRRMVRDAEQAKAGREAVSKRWEASKTAPDPTRTPNTPPNRGATPTPNSLDTEAEAEAETDKIFSLRSNISRARQARAADTPPKGFAEFWQHYPAKVGKGAALKAWPKAVREAGGDPSEIVIALKARLHLFNPEFVPNPATWLNQRRWEDDPETLLNRQARSA